MFVRKLLAGALAASLVGVARAKVTISEQGKEPSIARASACYLVAYEDLDQHQVACVSSRRVGSDLVVWDPVPTIVGSRPHEVDVGSNGDDFLVVWNTMSEPEEEGVGITCASPSPGMKTSSLWSGRTTGAEVGRYTVPA
jgi:hypothetical protein